MSRGDQRERDRAKNAAKLQQKAKEATKCGAPAQRNANDAAALQAKVAAKQQQACSGVETTGSGAPVPRKKVEKKKESLDDLLSAGLSSVKTGGSNKK